MLTLSAQVPVTTLKYTLALLTTRSNLEDIVIKRILSRRKSSGENPKNKYTIHFWQAF